LTRKLSFKQKIKFLIYKLAPYSGFDENSIDLLAKFYNFYAHRYKVHIFILFLGAVFSGVLELLGILLLYFLISLMIDVKSLESDHWVIEWFAYVGVTDKSYIIPVFGVAILSIFLIKNIYILFYYQLQHYTLRKWKNGISCYLMERYLCSQYVFLLSYNSATVIRNVSSTVNSALNGFVLSALNYCSNVVAGLVILSLLYVRYFGVTLVIASILIVSTVIQNRVLKKKQLDLGRRRQELDFEQTKSVYQGLHALKETKVVGKERFFLKIFKQINAKSIDNEMRSLLLTRLPAHVTEIVVIISTIIITTVVLYENSENLSISLSSLGVLGAIAFRIAPIMNRIVSALQSINKNQYSMAILFQEIEKLEAQKVTSAARERIKALPFNEAIEFKNVCFSYPNSKNQALTDVNFIVKKGQFVGVVGESGAGKTTLVDLFIGLLSPASGEVVVDNVILTPNNRDNWQKNIGYVPQSVFMSDASIAENVAFGVDPQNIDFVKVELCLKKVKLWDQVKANPEGLNFVIGENGKRLSGGQKQRIGIARSLYLNSPILVLDEATSSLDVPTEVQVSNAIEEVRGEKTVIVIAHRLSTILDADIIIFVDNGRVIDVGSYRELYNSNLKFNKLAQLAKIAPTTKSSE
jgi:ATP-binding cassette, subfamily B, bacterial PglK